MAAAENYADLAVHKACGHLLTRNESSGACCEARDFHPYGTDGHTAKVTDTVEQLTGRPPLTFDQLLADEAAAITAQTSATQAAPAPPAPHR